MVLRNMFEAGRADMVVRCLERVERTGVSLKDEEVRAKVFMGLRACASDAKWGKDETTWALKSMERVVELMEHRLHLGKWVARPGDARADPVLIGFPLEVAGMRVKKHVAGKDDGSVLTYATRTMAAFAQDDYMRVPISPCSPRYYSIANQDYRKPFQPSSLKNSATTLQKNPMPKKPPSLTSAAESTVSFPSGMRCGLRPRFLVRICPWRMMRRGLRLRFGRGFRGLGRFWRRRMWLVGWMRWLRGVGFSGGWEGERGEVEEGRVCVIYVLYLV